MICQLEHANISVVSNDRAFEFLKIAFPQFRRRGGGETDHGDWTEKWAHVGTDDLYVSLYETTHTEQAGRDAGKQTGINHVGFMVEDLEEVLGKYQAAGFGGSIIDERPSRLRLYIADLDGITWEFIQYLSDDPAVRNDYSI
jgi:catechol 2,3-dioxygenase-like lactoylglutathione lyase family enzyme